MSAVSRVARHATRIARHASRITHHTSHVTLTRYGTVKEVKIPVDRETGQARGFAFVTFGRCC